jgi:hypothetical protein
MMPSKSFACLAALCTVLLSAQDTPKTIALIGKTNVPASDIRKRLQKGCPNVSITGDVGITGDVDKSDYKLEAIKTRTPWGIGIEHIDKFDFTLSDHEDNTFSATSDTSLNQTLKDLCHAIKTYVIVEVVGTKTLTESVDVRGEGPGVVAGAVNSATGRRTHTDSSTIYVIVNGEHALLDCYERRTGCATIAPGKYYGERSGDGIWVSYRMPITHEPMRDHYKIAGSW